MSGGSVSTAFEATSRSALAPQARTGRGSIEPTNAATTVAALAAAILETILFVRSIDCNPRARSQGAKLAATRKVDHNTDARQDKQTNSIQNCQSGQDYVALDFRRAS